VEKKRLKRQDHSQDTIKKAQHFDLETRQTLFYLTEHFAKHQRESKH
jgi:hypothetical protein